jgi:predicted permease
MKMPVIAENEPFKNAGQVKAEIRNCDLFGGICQFACFAFAALGVIGDASKITLGLYSMSWFLLAIVAGLNAIIGHTRVVMAKHLLGVETESKKGNIELLKE